MKILSHSTRHSKPNDKDEALTHTFSLSFFPSFILFHQHEKLNMSDVPGVEHRDPQYFGYYAQLQHQVSALKKTAGRDHD